MPVNTLSDTSNGPAMTAPRVISIAMTTPPDSNGLTIQLNPRKPMGRSADASGWRARVDPAQADGPIRGRVRMARPIDRPQHSNQHVRNVAVGPRLRFARHW